MLTESSFHLVRSALEKSGVEVIVTALSEPAARIWAKSPQQVLSGTAADGTVAGFLGRLEERTVYKMTDAFEFCYLYFLLPAAHGEESRLFFAGPYLPTAISSRTVLALPVAQSLSAEKRTLLERYCTSIPIIPDDSHFFFLLDAFCETLWEGSYSVVDISQEQNMPVSPLNRTGEGDGFDRLRLDMELMEQRYRYENELIRAVALGQSGKANMILSAFQESNFEKRTQDSLRNLQNYCIIMNTLLRKAAEQGGVHPVYIDRVSSSFAKEIEQLQSTAAVPEVMRDMFRSYCRVVRRHSMKDYSPLVQNTIICIESDLSAHLTLSTLASVFKVSPGYLSTAFKRETGKTLTSYVCEKRMKHACHLLSTTHLQIQSVAMQCGILDLQYFSKLFKRHTGQSPKEYREKVSRRD